MAQASERPRRKRLSWESRCEIVARIEAGMSPPLAAASGGASRATGYRPAAPATKAVRGGRAADPCQPPPLRVSAGAALGACALPALDDREGAAP